MSFKIEISNETADCLFCDILVQDYRALKKDTVALEERLEDLAPYEFEDLVNNRRWLQAMATMMEFYLTSDQMKEVLGENSTSK